MEKFEVVIVGAGPAGLSAAKVLGEGGKTVLVLEKKERIGPKICAGGLTSKDLEIGIPLSLAERVFHSIKIHAFGKTIKIERKKPLVVTISRERLGQWQAQQIKKNVEIRLNSEVAGIKENTILLKTGQEIGFNYLIGADGSTSIVRKYLNLPTRKVWLAMQYIVPKVFNELEVFFNKNLFGSGYAWFFPHKDYTSVGWGGKAKFRETSIFQNFHYWLKQKK